MCRHGHSNTQQTQHFPHWRIYHRIQIWWNCQNICYFHTCQQQQQQLRRLYIAHRCMDFCRAGTPKTDWSSGLDWEELFLEHISVRGGNCLLLSFLSPREGFQWNKKRKKKRWEGADVLLYGAGTPSQRSTDVRNLAENTDALVGEQVMQGRRDEDTLNLPLIRVSVKVSISPQSVSKYKWFTHLCMCVCVCVLVSVWVTGSHHCKVFHAEGKSIPLPSLRWQPQWKRLYLYRDAWQTAAPPSWSWWIQEPDLDWMHASIFNLLQPGSHTHTHTHTHTRCAALTGSSFTCIPPANLHQLQHTSYTHRLVRWPCGALCSTPAPQTSWGPPLDIMWTGSKTPRLYWDWSDW